MITIPESPLPAEQMKLLEKTISYEQASLAANTRRTYSVMWEKFATWCHRHGLSALPASAETISLYLGSLGGSKTSSTIDNTVAAIEKKHAQAGLTISGPDLYRRVRKGIRRMHPTERQRQAKALSLLDLTLFCRRPIHPRDKAIVTVGFFGALRRSELVALNIEHVEFLEKGAVLRVVQSKTNLNAVDVYLSRTKDPSICPVLALQDWLAASEREDGPLFRAVLKGGKLGNRLTGHAVSVIIKKHFGNEYSGHSCRRGLITILAEKGVPLHRIQAHSRHRSADMVMRYIEKAEGFENSSGASLGV